MARREVIVKADRPEQWGQKISKLSNLDLLMPPFHVWSTLFYDYSVSAEKFERALAKTLTRYGELAGRLVVPEGEVDPVVELNNEGVQLVYLEQSTVSIKVLQEKQFENDFVYHHFCEEQDDIDTASSVSLDRAFLLKIRVQKLSTEGLVVSLGFHYQICDVNSMYVFTADLCSLIRRNIFAFKESQLQIFKRCEVFKPNSDRIMEHPEYEIANSDATQQKWEALITDVAQNPRVNVRFQITRKNLELMKAEICIKHPNEVPVSTNDCIASVFWKACVKGLVDAKPSQDSVFQLACNGRFRRKPPLPRTFFGNAMFIVYTNCHKEKLCKDSAYRTACRIRKSVLKVSNEYMQSVVNFVEKEGADNVQFSSGHQTLDFSITNWNQYFDWYKDGDMGKGKPIKFLVVSKHLAGMAIILPAESDGLEILTGLTREQFQIVLTDDYIKKYFTWC